MPTENRSSNTEHALKIHEDPFAELLAGAKTCEVRKDDRGFAVGDTVQLHECGDASYTGRTLRRTITHIQRGYGLPEGLCVLSYAQSAAQHQGEPVGWTYEDGKEYTACPDHAHDLRAEGIELTEVYTQQQHQGEPVAWINPHWDGKSARFIFGSKLADEPCPELWKPLYTHVDTGEVERLRDALDECDGERWKLRTERDTLRGQLVERNSLLTAAKNVVEAARAIDKEAFGKGAQSVDPCRFRGLGVLLEQYDAALSASTEPAPTSDGFSPEQMTAQGADGYRNGIKAAAELAADYPELAQAIRDLSLPQ